MTLILGDVKWLVDGLPQHGRDIEVVILVTNGAQTLKLPVSKVTMDKKLVITCELPSEQQDDKKGTP